MRSRTNCTVSASQVHRWALQWLLQAELLKKGRQRTCTAEVVWSIVLRAAVQMISICAACLDMADGPSDQAVFDALEAGLPKTLSVLERRLNESLTDYLPRSMRRRAWHIAIDWHLVPYYGEPHRSKNELYYGKPRQGTKHFHAYATACVVVHGQRYTLALSWVRRHESTVTVLKRLIERIRVLGLKIKVLLMDRAFFNVPVTSYLKDERLPFLMPVMFRGRPSKKRKPRTGLRWIERQGAGRYPHTLKNRNQQVKITVVVAFRSYKKGKRRIKQKLLFGAWRVGGDPQYIRSLYRTRFGIEASYRQLRQARIYTCTRKPHLRLVFIGIALLLRNLWVWIHAEQLGERRDHHREVRLEQLRFKRMLQWLVQTVATLLHDASIPCVVNNI
jgi:hypothetical protein